MDLSGFAWLAVIPALGLLILVHELGHFYMARKMGVKVLEFGIGLPPRAATLFERNGVKYTLNWLPLGGFVRMVGEDGNFEAPGSLAAAPPWKKIPVLAAGVIMNALTAIVIFAIIFSVWGVGTSDPSRIVVGELIAPSSAHTQGVLPNDQLLSLDGKPITEPGHVRQYILESKQADKQQVELVVNRDGKTERFLLTPELFPDRADPEIPKIGIVATPAIVYKPVNPLKGLALGAETTYRILVDMVQGLGQLVGGLIGVAAAPEGGVTGIIGIARITGSAIKSGFRKYLELTAILSINLALINLLPIPALDGSRIIFALVEWVRRGRRIAPEKEALVHAIGMIFLLGLMVLISISDVGRAINGQAPLP